MFPNIGPMQSWNMDETGLSGDKELVSNEVVYVDFEDKSVSYTIAGFRERTSIVFCINRHQAVPPVFIMTDGPKLEDALVLKDAPVGSLLWYAPAGTMTEQLFKQWLMHFEKYARFDSNQWLWLRFDSCPSHLTLDGMAWALAHRILNHWHSKWNAQNAGAGRGIPDAVFQAPNTQIVSILGGNASSGQSAAIVRDPRLQSRSEQRQTALIVL